MRTRFKLLSRDDTAAGVSSFLSPPHHLSTRLLHLSQMALCFAFTADQTRHPGRLYVVTPQWVAKEAGVTAAQHAQRETPEVVTMETALVVPPFFVNALCCGKRCQLLSVIYIYLHITWAGDRVWESKGLLMMQIKFHGHRLCLCG